MALTIGLVTACASLTQSLWLDELHTSWSSTGSWSDVSGRAALGNQLPLYFGGLWLLSQTFGASELVLRLPSLVAWLLTLAIVGTVFYRQGTARAITLWPLLVFLALDRNQIFFATEARPYALLSLVNLLAWLSLDRLRAEMSSPEASASRCLGWLTLLTGLDGLAFWIQPTAVLHVAVQFLFLIMLTLRSDWRRNLDRPQRDAREVQRYLWSIDLWFFAAAVFMLGAIMWPARSVLLPAWQHRQQWASFASDISLLGTLRLLPLRWLLLPVLVGLMIQFAVRYWGGRDRSTEGEVRQAKQENIEIQAGLWLCAGCGPLVIVVLMAALHVAPLAHPRYLVAAVPPLVIASGLMLSHLRWPSARRIIMCSMLVTFLWSQRDVPAWLECVQQRRWPMIVRGEDWRAAVRWMVEHSDAEPGSNSDSRPLDIFCASMLIEGSQPTSDPLLREYLALPLKSLYAPPRESRITPLLNAPSSWRSEVQRAQQQSVRKSCWLIVRVSARTFPARLEASGLEIKGEPVSFGGVTVARLSEPATSSP